MKIFIIGATGALGAPVAKRLSERGHEIVALARSAESEQRVRMLGYKAVRGDMIQPAPWLQAAAAADAIVHAAWVRPGRRMDRAWLTKAMAADAVAIDGLVNAARIGNRCQALVPTSGYSVYGDHGDEWIDEDTPPVPGPDSMGLKQLACERAAMSAFDSGLPAFVLRPCTMYGAHGAAMDYFFGSASQQRIEYPGPGDNFFPFVHHADLAEAYALAIERRPVGEIISVGDDEPLRLRTVAELALGAFGGGEQVSLAKSAVAEAAGVPFAEIMTASCRVRNAKAKKLLGWSPKVRCLRDGLEQAAREWKAAHAQ